MSVSGPAVQSSRHHQKLRAAIFDVDGVLLASPHERAWREALEGFADPARFTSDMYEDQVAGKPRLAGAVAALEALGLDDRMLRQVARMCVARAPVHQIC